MSSTYCVFVSEETCLYLFDATTFQVLCRNCVDLMLLNIHHAIPIFFETHNIPIEKDGSANPGSEHAYLIQPSAHIGINGVQANAPEDVEDPQFINCAAYWLIDTEMVVSFDVEKMYNYRQYARNMQLDFRPDKVSLAKEVYQNYHVLGYMTTAKKNP